MLGGWVDRIQVDRIQLLVKMLNPFSFRRFSNYDVQQTADVFLRSAQLRSTQSPARDIMKHDTHASVVYVWAGLLVVSDEGGVRNTEAEHVLP